MKFIIRFLGFKKIAYLSLVLFLLIILDLLGILLLYPLISLIQKGSEESYTLLVNNIESINLIKILTNENVLFILLIIFTSFYLFKFFINVWLTKIQHKIISKLAYDLSRTMYERILSLNYRTFQNHSASQLMGVVYNNPIHASICLGALATIFSDLVFVLILIFVSFFFFKILTLLVLTYIVLVAVIFYYVFIRKVEKLGVEQSIMETKQHKISFATISAIKDIKIMGIEDLFIKQHRKISDFFLNSTWKVNLTNSSLRYSIETVLFISILIIAFWIRNINFSNASAPIAIVLLGLFLRLLPSFNRISTSIQNLKFYSPFVQKIQFFYNDSKESSLITIDDHRFFSDSLQIKALSFSYGQKQILKNLNFKITKGETVGIVGKSGSGKTTLLDILSGLQEKSSGNIFLDGAEIDPYRTNIMTKLIGYVPQNVTLLDESIRFNITFDQNFDSLSYYNAIKSSNLSNFIDQLPDGDLTCVGENGINISGGQKQRIGIARALYRNPEILLFDESTSSLDNVTERELINEIDKLGRDKTIIFVTHRLSTIKHCDNIIVIENGSIVGYGKYDDLIINNKAFRSLNLKSEII